MPAQPWQWPSLVPDDTTVLAPGLVLTLEPGMALPGGRIMVHEENIVIRGGPPAFLSPRAGPEIAVLEG